MERRRFLQLGAATVIGLYAWQIGDRIDFDTKEERELKRLKKGELHEAPKVDTRLLEPVNLIESSTPEEFVKNLDNVFNQIIKTNFTHADKTARLDFKSARFGIGDSEKSEIRSYWFTKGILDGQDYRRIRMVKGRIYDDYEFTNNQLITHDIDLKPATLNPSPIDWKANANTLVSDYLNFRMDPDSESRVLLENYKKQNPQGTR